MNGFRRHCPPKKFVAPAGKSPGTPIKHSARKAESEKKPETEYFEGLKSLKNAKSEQKYAQKNATIINKVLDCPTVPWVDLKKYEANRLKSSERRNVAKLKAAILAEGFSFPLIVWAPANAGKMGNDPPYVIDGAGRMAALHQLEKDGYAIPDIPVALVDAENREQAKKWVTLASSQFGVVDKDSYTAFVQDLGGFNALLPDISINSTVFATDFVGPVVGPEEDASKKRVRRGEKDVEIPEFEAADIIEFGPHSLMVGYEEQPIIAKIVKFIRKEWPELEITKNGENLP